MAQGLWSCHFDSNGTMMPVGRMRPSNTGDAPADSLSRILASGVLLLQREAIVPVSLADAGQDWACLWDHDLQ